jgi:hypothetical protein
VVTNIAARLMVLSWRLYVVWSTFAAEIKAHFKRLLALAEKMTANMLAMDVSETDKPTLAMKLEVVLTHATLLLHHIALMVEQYLRAFASPQKRELRKFCQANEETALGKVLLADTDGDGQISKSEWLEAVHSNEWIKRFVCPRMFVQNAQSDMF